MKKIVGFGDSFILGNELHNPPDGSLAWPGLIAARLGVDYHTTAEPGVGNEHIAQQVYEYFNRNTARDTLAVINWTWSMRWDIFLEEKQTWANIGPTCVPGKLQGILNKKEAEKLIEFYKHRIEPNSVWNRFRSLQAIWGVQKFLDDMCVKSIHTCMDPTIYGDGPPRLEHYDAYKSQSWPVIQDENDLENLPNDIKKELNESYNKLEMPGYVKQLQQLTQEKMLSFDGDTFLEWSYRKRFSVTALLHPLHEAHLAAADYWQEYYKNLLA